MRNFARRRRALLQLDQAEAAQGKEIELQLEVLHVIDSSLPLIGRTKAAELMRARPPDARPRAPPQRAASCTSTIVLKPHRARDFLELHFSSQRKEEQS